MDFVRRPITSVQILKNGLVREGFRLSKLCNSYKYIFGTCLVVYPHLIILASDVERRRDGIKLRNYDNYKIKCWGKCNIITLSRYRLNFLAFSKMSCFLILYQMHFPAGVIPSTTIYTCLTPNILNQQAIYRYRDPPESHVSIEYQTASTTSRQLNDGIQCQSCNKCPLQI